jgi:hypothetical protein
VASTVFPPKTSGKCKTSTWARFFQKEGNDGMKRREKQKNEMNYMGPNGSKTSLGNEIAAVVLMESTLEIYPGPF